MYTILRQLIQRAVGYIHYQMASIRNYYPCRFVAQQYCAKSGKTKIVYTIFGKHQSNVIAVDELLSDASFLNKFKPTQAAILGAIALGDHLFNLPEEARHEAYLNFKNNLLESRKA